MQFSADVVMFDYAGFPIVGNLSNGYIIGLNPEGKSLCEQLLFKDLAPEDIQAVDANLWEHLMAGGFFDGLSIKDHIDSAYIHVTQRCNLDCVGCYSKNEQRNNAADPELSLVKRALKELTLAGLKSIVISGGEPFLRDDLAEIANYAHSDCKIQHITVITNGTILHNEAFKQLAGFVDQIAVSVDGFSADCISYIRKQQRFDQIMDTVAAIRKQGIPVHITPTIHSKNIVDIPEYLKLAKRLNASLNFSLLSCPSTVAEVKSLLPSDTDLLAIGRMSSRMDKSERIVFEDTPLKCNISAKKACGAGRNAISIANDGEVYPCHMLHNDSYSFGNVFSDTLSDVLLSEIRSDFASIGVDSISKCSICDIKYLCGGGCRARSLFAFGDITSPDPYCIMTKEHYRRFGEYLRQSA